MIGIGEVLARVFAVAPLEQGALDAGVRSAPKLAPSHPHVGLLQRIDEVRVSLDVRGSFDDPVDMALRSRANDDWGSHSPDGYRPATDREIAEGIVDRAASRLKALANDPDMSPQGHAQLASAVRSLRAAATSPAAVQQARDAMESAARGLREKMPSTGRLDAAMITEETVRGVDDVTQRVEHLRERIIIDPPRLDPIAINRGRRDGDVYVPLGPGRQALAGLREMTEISHPGDAVQASLVEARDRMALITGAIERRAQARGGSRGAVAMTHADAARLATDLDDTLTALDVISGASHRPSSEIAGPLRLERARDAARNLGDRLDDADFTFEHALEREAAPDLASAIDVFRRAVRVLQDDGMLDDGDAAVAALAAAAPHDIHGLRSDQVAHLRSLAAGVDAPRAIEA